MRSIRIVVTSIALALSALLSAFGQIGPAIGATPISLPGLSPTMSASFDDVPPTTDDILALDTYGNPYNIRGRANFMLRYMDVSPTSQRVWFSLSAVGHPARVYYNQRRRVDTSSPWYWDYTYSPALLEITENNSPDNRVPPSIAFGTVLYSASGFVNVSTGLPYNYIMYLIYQPTQCNGVVAGYLVVAFSSDGISWTSPYQVERISGPSFPCWAGHTQTVPVESASGVFDPTSATIYLMGLEGDASLLSVVANMNRTLTNIGTSAATNPGLVTLNSPTEIAAGGIYTPNAYGPYASSQYTPYAYFVNLQMAWDAVHGDLYVSRAYPYGFDRQENANYSAIPLHSAVYNRSALNPEDDRTVLVDGCASGLATYPTRVQINKIHLGTLANFGALTYTPWTLVLDYGNSNGYAMYANPTTLSGSTTAPLYSYAGQTSVNRDLGSGSFIADPSGALAFYGTTTYWLGGDDRTQQRTNGAGTCRVTGLERITQYTLTP